ncbi:MAG: AAA family ATPase, partial [Rhodospirillaceae bacterium]|nr:AAA family ATPase [Rhodospirillaceae bacterium]
VHLCLLRSGEIQELRAAMRERVDDRLELAGLTTDGAETSAHIAASQPDVVIVGVELFPEDSRSDLLGLLAELQTMGQAAIVLTEVWDQDLHGDLKRLAAVDAVEVRPISADRVIARALDSAKATRAARSRARREETVAAERLAERLAVPPSGRSIICVTARKGGIGKDTLASNLAWAVAERNVPVLLIGADPKDDLAAYCGVDPSPGVAAFLRKPNREGFGSGLQRFRNFHLMVGLADDHLAAQWNARFDREEPNLVRELLVTARDCPYGVVVVTLPTEYGHWRFQPLARADRILYVVTPAQADVVNAIRDITAIRRDIGREFMPEDRLFLLLNRVRSGDRRRLTEIATVIAEGVGFEVPVVGTIPDAHPYVAVAQSRGELPHSWMIDELEPFRAAFDDLAERLGLAPPRTPDSDGGSHGFRALLRRMLRGEGRRPTALPSAAITMMGKVSA